LLYIKINLHDQDDMKVALHYWYSSSFSAISRLPNFYVKETYIELSSCSVQCTCYWTDRHCDLPKGHLHLLN